MRLTNRAITTARLLSQSGLFTQELIQRIDSSTTLALKNKVVQAYDYQNNRIYSYADVPGDVFAVDARLLNDARVSGSRYFRYASKEAVAFHYTSPSVRMVLVVAGEDEEGEKTLDRLKNILLLSFLGGTLFALAGGYFFSAGLIRPVKKIALEVADISAHNLSRRIDTGVSKDEWYHLADTLNQLLDRLQESFEVQRRFISNASHELSTPLTAISSQLEVILQKERDPEAYRQVMQSVLQDVRNLSRLTQTLLEFAKASGNPGGLEIQPVRIDEVLMQMPAEMQKSNKAYSVSLQFGDLPDNEDALVVYGNEELLFTAIKNIVINACKYSNDKRAEIVFYYKDGNLVIEIKDRGVGIAENDLVNIYQPFYRGDDSRTTPGFGLGLSLANRIIKLHKGNIRVRSTVNEGSAFIIQLPSSKS